jgi:anti-sigma B factor antagonist
LCAWAFAANPRTTNLAGGGAALRDAIGDPRINTPLTFHNQSRR